MLKILDCTLRDGGYYTNWDFNSETVDAYIQAMNVLPVDYLELGYRNNPTKEYMGKFGYCPVSVLKHIRQNCTKKLDVMLNEKSTKIEDLDTLLSPIVGLVDMVRIAIDPKNFDRAVILAKAVKAMDFEVGFNVMYMSKWQTEYPEFITKLGVLDSFADLFCMVDSFGGVTPEDVTDIVKVVRENTKCPIGFHGHNNLQLGLINTITALKLGVDYVDATILGMGRGAGNLNMELLLTYLNAHEDLKVDFNVLGDVITAFTPLLDKYRWGTNLPYMLAGANRIPQKEVMDWVTNRVYSFNSIVRALDNRKNNAKDNAQFPHLNVEKKFDKVLIIGGGNNAIEHKDAIKELIAQEENITVVFATARNAKTYQDINAPVYYVLVGNEGRRLSANVGEKHFNGTCVLPPYPRTMGTEVPAYAENHTVELTSVNFTDLFKDSVTTIALQLAMNLTDGDIFVIGYDGYPGNVLSEKEVALTNENKTIFQSFKKAKGEQLKSLTPSLYKDLEVVSVYQFI
ncbi:aldolase catalytic domain-containing protein [Bacteroides sp. GM023]|uniref:aldolase catalytic domain-containing protein n=1 Tax=Bacteroides sp. GM023 TaxID=2723058 RepID=UPI001CC3163A|nr:aldolase catalytic domain-containing protein [Bacteroides sp. GM023]